MTAGALLSYSLVAGLSLAIFYAACKRATAAGVRPATSRAILLFSYLGAFVLIPLWLRLAAPSGPSASTVLPASDVTISEIVATAEVGADEAPRQSPLLTACLWIYLAGMALALVHTAVSQIYLLLIVRRSRVERRRGYNLAVVDSRPGLPAFCRWRTIFMGSHCAADDSAAIILAHERAHIALRHRYDLIVAQAAAVLCWYNPAAWLMRRELREVHEFQADRSVLDAGTDAGAYQMLLIKTAVGPRFQSLTNSLNHSKLKKRITMMNSPKRSGRRLAALLLVPATLTAAAVLDSSFVEEILASGSAATLTQTETDCEINEIAADTQLPDPISLPAAAAEESLREEPAAATLSPAPEAERPAPDPSAVETAVEKAAISETAVAADTTATTPGKLTLYYIDKREVTRADIDRLSPEDIKMIDVRKGTTADIIDVTLKSADTAEKNYQVKTPMTVGDISLDNIGDTNVSFTVRNLPGAVAVSGAKLVNGNKTYDSKKMSVRTHDDVSEIKVSFKKLKEFKNDCHVSLNINGSDVTVFVNPNRRQVHD